MERSLHGNPKNHAKMHAPYLYFFIFKGAGKAFAIAFAIAFASIILLASY